MVFRLSLVNIAIALIAEKNRNKSMAAFQSRRHDHVLAIATQFHNFASHGQNCTDFSCPPAEDSFGGR
jgi:hypothetical protein